MQRSVEAGGISSGGQVFVSLIENTVVRSRRRASCLGLLDGEAKGGVLR